MSRYTHYFIVLLLSAMSCCLTGCNKERMGDDDIKVTIPSNGYIHFGYNNLTRATKSNLVETMSGKNYSVIAFEYQNSTTWDNFKATGKPSSSQFPFPTEVNYDNENRYWTYDASSTTDDNGPLVPWSSTSKYTFFAYYPQSLSPVGDENTANTPHITYSIDPEDTDPQNMSDVMIASEKDVINDGTGVVNFHFKHALSCLTYEARNFDEVESTATDQEKEAKKQYVKGLQVYFTSKMYTSIDIPLDADMEATASNVQEGGFHFVINAPTESTDVPALVKGEQIEMIDVAKGNNLLIIPQRPDGPDGIADNADDMGKLTGYVTFYCKDSDGNEAFRTGNPSATTSEDYRPNLYFESDKSFEAGKKYSLVINFTSNAQISVAIIESGDWTDSDQTITFE